MVCFSRSQHTGNLFPAVKRDAQADTPIAIGVDNQVFDGSLFDVEAVVVEQNILEVPLVEGAIDLRAGALDCRPFSPVQDLNRVNPVNPT